MIRTNLEKTIRDLNRMAGDSCKLAQGLVDTAADKLGVNALKEQMEQGPISAAARSLGEAIDEFDSFLNKINSGTATSKMPADKINALLGNVAWKVLQNDGYINAAFMTSGRELAEVLMSLTGTVIGTKTDDSDQALPNIVPKPPLITFKDVMEGGSGINEVKKYTCGGDTDQCLAPDTETYNFKGLQKMVTDVLLGPDATSISSDSMVSQLLTNNGTLTNQAKQLTRIAPFHTTRLRTMAVCTMASGGVGSLEQYAKEASGLIALEVLEKYLRDAISAIKLASGQLTVDVDGKLFPSALSSEYQEKLQKLSKEVQEAHNVLYGAKQQTLEEIYNNSMKSCNTKNLVVRQKGG